MRIPLSTPLMALLLVTATACEEPAERLPGVYVGQLDATVQASRMGSRRPDGNGGLVADVRHYSGGSSASDARLSVRRAEDVGGSPSFEATLADVCDLRFQLLDGGRISENMLPVTCRCLLDGHPVAGDAMVSGSFDEDRLELQVDVTLPRTEYAGGCTYSFMAGRPGE